LSSQKLAEVFARHGHADYAAILSALPVEQLAGYLHGFLDRLAFHKGMWGVVDWKTNRLGPAVENYATPSLDACARHSHYLLQTHLYLVALRRYLGPDTPIAGAWLVFLRGIRAGTADGVLHIQPRAELMKELDALFAQAAAPALS
jgi:exodeoxyribonuclease V beta subunit